MNRLLTVWQLEGIENINPIETKDGKTKSEKLSAATKRNRQTVDRNMCWGLREAFIQ